MKDLEMKENVNIDFEKIEIMMSSNDMMAAFCQTASALFEDFEKDYISALIDSDITQLDEVTHKILSTTRMMGLEDFYLLTKTYKELNLGDENSKAPLIAKLSDYVEAIKYGLKVKIDGLRLQ